MAISQDEISTEVEEIGSNEIICRSLQLNEQNFKVNPDKSWKLSSQAFSCKSKEVSFHRHHLCEDPPYSNPPRLGKTDAVVTLIVKDVLGIEPIPHAEDKHIVNIRPDIADHRSHCVVYGNPPFRNKGFERLKARLALLAENSGTWLIPPSDEFLTEQSSQNK